MTPQEYVKKWAAILRVADWKIAAIFDDSLEPPDAGYVRRLSAYKEASIYVGTWLDETLLEDTIVHELVHLHLAPFETEDGTAERFYEEQAVESMTRAFTDLARGGAPARVIIGAAKKLIRTARKETVMDAKQVIEALRAADGDAALKILEEYVAEQLAGADGGDGEGAPMAAVEDLTKKPAGELPMAGAMDSKIASKKMARVSMLEDKSEELAAKQYKRLLIKEAREQLGTECTTFFEKKLLEAASPEIAEAILDGATSRGPERKSAVGAERQSERRGANVIPLRQGEDEAKIPAHEKQRRMRLVRQLGPDKVAAMFAGATPKATRIVGRRAK